MTRLNLASMLPALLLAAAVLACTEPRADFMTRVAEDCRTGDQAACNLLKAPPNADAFSGLPNTRPGTRTLVQEDLEAMIRGMSQARNAPRYRREGGSAQ